MEQPSNGFKTRLGILIKGILIIAHKKTYIDGHLSCDQPIPTYVHHSSPSFHSIFNLYKWSSHCNWSFHFYVCSAASGHDLLNLIKHVNTEVNKITVWFCANNMAVNTSKTKLKNFIPEANNRYEHWFSIQRKWT